MGPKICTCSSVMQLLAFRPPLLGSRKTPRQVKLKWNKEEFDVTIEEGSSVEAGIAELEVYPDDTTTTGLGDLRK